MSIALGHKYPSTVQYWWDKNKFPAWRRAEIIAASRKKRLGLKESDLVF